MGATTQYTTYSYTYIESYINSIIVTNTIIYSKYKLSPFY